MVLCDPSGRCSASWSTILTGHRRLIFFERLCRPVKLACFLALTFFLLASGARADSFGRFGYGAGPGIPDIDVTKAGLSAEYAGASHIDFTGPATKFTVQSTHSTAQMCLVDGPEGCPRKIRSSLVGNSVDLYFTNGITLICRSKEPPFLSWADGSMGHDVPPTPDLKWALLSFSTAEPPYLFGFEGETANLQVKGSAGNWTIVSPSFSGWMRIWLPFGIDPQFGTDAAGLGRLANQVSKYSWLWETKTPTVSRVLVKGDDLGVDATWKFDGRGAFVPQAPQLAQLGGSALSIVTPMELLPGGGNSGPYAFVKEDELTIHFPARRIKPGRAVGNGNPPKPSVATGSVSDTARIVEMACESLLALDNGSQAKLADDTVTRFLVETTYSLEPNTKQQLPFAADGTGLELAAAHAFLAQAAMLAEGVGQPNALYDSILWRRDWWTWTIPAKDQDVSRKATALTAIAGALSADPASRLYAATLEAGLEGERGRLIYRKRKNMEVPAKELIEPLMGLRQGIFALNRPKDPGLSFYDLVQSPLKVAAGSVVTSEKAEGGWLVKWKGQDKKGGTLKLFMPDAVQVAIKENLKSTTLTKTADGQLLTFFPIAPGSCSAVFSAVPALLPLPLEVAPPSY